MTLARVTKKCECGYSLPILGSINPPGRGRPLSSFTSGNSILATEYAFYAARGKAEKGVSITGGGDSGGGRVKALPSGGKASATTYDIFRTENTELDFLDGTDGRIRVRERGRHDATS